MDLEYMSNSSIEERKKKHLEICLDPNLPIEGESAGFDDFGFIHRSLPEIDANSIDLSTHLFGQDIKLPLFISSMTGGSAEGFKANKELARAANQAGIPVGMGSIRILFEEESVFPHFHLKKIARDVPVFANLGFVQIRDFDHSRIIEMLKRLEVQGLAIHLNPAQEIFQIDGDRNFEGIRESLGRFMNQSPVPVMVKETGMGIGPREVRDLKELGATYVNVAGAGGTNWASVEAFRGNDLYKNAALEFKNWGLKTAHILYALNDQVSGVLASGGIRNAMDIAKSLALGADAVGMALPFIRAVKADGADGVLTIIDQCKKVLESVCLLTGVSHFKDLSRDHLLVSHHIQEQIKDWKDKI
ncbi:type 2 isopentenyl-diphosphate Delta-isomerase [Spirochaeta cellobiosiphila]|uniref:type 2 isopentenyl-diphosphate Delta-isomerase n=1 Tax=Spirochaeta cellobiosiphila TaxID=504483 RepID=UPI000490E6B2|nr:type 2 isopentenyl-diphosphate Delta-isomerase [Spirochaeta cellobiosiphila]